MKDQKQLWVPVAWHCPNCGEKTQAYMTIDGKVKAECVRCRMVVVRRKVGRRHTRLDVYAFKEGEKKNKSAI